MAGFAWSERGFDAVLIFYGRTRGCGAASPFHHLGDLGRGFCDHDFAGVFSVPSGFIPPTIRT